MKKILSIIFLCIFFYPISTIYSQWVIQNSPVTSSLTDVTFININTGWICGDGGVIIKTTNRGTNWFIQNSGVSNILSGIHAIDSDYIYCDGWWNTILKSTNGGNNWTIIRNGVSSSGISFYGIYFLNRNTGWLLRNNYILKTVNGGITFDSTHEIFTYLRDAFLRIHWKVFYVEKGH